MFRHVQEHGPDLTILLTDFFWPEGVSQFERLVFAFEVQVLQREVEFFNKLVLLHGACLFLITVPVFMVLVTDGHVV